MPFPAALLFLQPNRLDLLANQYLGTVKRTQYSHHRDIRADEGLFLCDCSEWVGFLLEKGFPEALSEIPISDGKIRQRAVDFCNYFRHLSAPSANWSRVWKVSFVQPGDVIAWDLPKGAKDTGHVMIARRPPSENRDGSFSINVSDSSALLHDEDSRARGSGGGVGTGTITLLVDTNGAPVGFKFRAKNSAHLSVIGIARLRGS